MFSSLEKRTLKLRFKVQKDNFESVNFEDDANLKKLQLRDSQTLSSAEKAIVKAELESRGIPTNTPFIQQFQDFGKLDFTKPDTTGHMDNADVRKVFGKHGIKLGKGRKPVGAFTDIVINSGTKPPPDLLNAFYNYGKNKGWDTITGKLTPDQQQWRDLNDVFKDNMKQEIASGKTDAEIEEKYGRGYIDSIKAEKTPTDLKKAADALRQDTMPMKIRTDFQLLTQTVNDAIAVGKNVENIINGAKEEFKLQIQGLEKAGAAKELITSLEKTFDTQIKTLADRVSAVEKMRAGLNTRIEKLETAGVKPEAIDNLRKEFNAQIGDLDKKIYDNEGFVLDQNDRYDKINMKIENIIQKIKDDSATFKSFQKEFGFKDNIIKQSIDNIKGKLGLTDEKIKGVKQSIDAGAAKVELLDKELRGKVTPEELSRIKETLSKDIGDAKHTFATREEGLEDAKREIKELRDEISKVRDELKAKQVSLGEPTKVPDEPTTALGQRINAELQKEKPPVVPSVKEEALSEDQINKLYNKNENVFKNRRITREALVGLTKTNIMGPHGKQLSGANLGAKVKSLLSKRKLESSPATQDLRKKHSTYREKLLGIVKSPAIKEYGDYIRKMEKPKPKSLKVAHEKAQKFKAHKLAKTISDHEKLSRVEYRKVREDMAGLIKKYPKTYERALGFDRKGMDDFKALKTTKQISKDPTTIEQTKTGLKSEMDRLKKEIKGKMLPIQKIGIPPGKVIQVSKPSKDVSITQPTQDEIKYSRAKSPAAIVGKTDAGKISAPKIVEFQKPAATAVKKVGVKSPVLTNLKAYIGRVSKLGTAPSKAPSVKAPVFTSKGKVPIASSFAVKPLGKGGIKNLLKKPMR